MNPQELEGFSHLDREGCQITVLGPIGPEDDRVEVEREDGARWGCPVAYLADLYVQHTVDCYAELLALCVAFDNLFKECFWDEADKQWIKIPYLDFTCWDMDRKTALQKARKT